MITTLLEVYQLPNHILRFARIGSHPRVHYTAKDVYDGKICAKTTLTAEDIIGVIRKRADERLRACFPTLVDAQGRSLTPYYTNKSSRVNRKKRSM